MRLYWIAAFSIGLLMASHSSFAEGGADLQTEVIAGFGDYQIQKAYPAQFSLQGGNLGIGREITHFLEASLRVSFRTYSSTDSVPGGTNLFATLGPTFNFFTFFISLGAGINYNHINPFEPGGTLYFVPGASTIAFAYSIELGKRFALLPNVSWIPTLGLNAYSGDDINNNGLKSYPIFMAIPLRISVHF